jgi:hypothetical protein
VLRLVLSCDWRSGQVRSGQVHSSAEVQDHEVTSLESSYARQIRDDAAEPATNVADSENYSDVLRLRLLPRPQYRATAAGTGSSQWNTDSDQPRDVYLVT